MPGPDAAGGTRAPAAAGFVIRAVGALDLPALVQFHCEVYPELREDPRLAQAFYRWKYLDGEGRRSEFPSGYLACDAEGITGFLGCLPFQLACQGRVVQAGWVADWKLLDRARGRGLGRQLLEAAMRGGANLACVNGTPDAEKIFAANGFRAVPCARSWMYVLRPWRFERPRRTGLRYPIGLLRAGLRKAEGYRARRAVPVREGVTLATSPDGWRIIERLGPEPGDGMVRTPAFWNWLARAPVARLEVLEIRQAGKAGGYAVIQRDRDRLGRRRGRILEVRVCSGSKEDRVDAYSAVAQRLSRAGATDYMELRAPTSHHEALLEAGYEPRGVDRLWLRVPGLDPGLDQGWHVTLADKDDAFRGSGLIP